jgi:protein-disulfide isomerase
LTLVAALALFGAGLASYQYYISSWGKNAQLPQLQQRIGQLETQLNTMNGQVKDLQNQIAQQNQTLRAVTDLLQRQGGTGSPSQGSTPAKIDTEGQPSLGSASAPVVIVAFSDFQCPYCGRFEEQTFPRLKTDYIDTGKVRFVFFDFPLSQLHPNAELAAEAAACAQEQGAYWPMHDLLFRKQAEWAGTSNSSTEGLFRLYAQSLNLKADQFATCLSDQRYVQGIKKDQQVGLDAGVQGTPTFFINGRELVGAQPYEAFKQLIDAALANPPH